MNEGALDASAVLAVINREPGAAVVIAAMAGGRTVISAVNLSEVVAKLTERGLTEHQIGEVLAPLPFTVHPFDEVSAHRAGLLRRETRHLGLSLGDRACLALAATLGVPAITMEHAWGRLDLGIEVVVARPASTA